MGGCSTDKLSPSQQRICNELSRECDDTAAAAVQDAQGKSSFTVVDGAQSKKYEFKNANICHVAALGYAINQQTVAPVANYDKYLTKQAGLSVVVDEKNSVATAFFGDAAGSHGLKCLLTVNSGELKVNACSYVAGVEVPTQAVAGFSEQIGKITKKLDDAKAALKALTTAEENYTAGFQVPEGSVLFVSDSTTETSIRERTKLTGEMHIFNMSEHDDGTTKTIRITDRSMRDDGDGSSGMKNTVYDVALSKSAPNGAPQSTYTNDPRIEDALIKTGNTTIFIIDHKREMPRK